MSNPDNRCVRLYGAVLLLIVSGGGAAYLYYFHFQVQPPEVDLAGIDPAIKMAVDEARKKVLEQPTSSQAWGRLGMVLITHDFRVPAKFCLEQAERLDPEELRWPYFHALGAIAFGEGESAIPKLERAAALSSAATDSPRLRLAELYLSLEQLDEAETHFRRLLEINSQHAKARLGMARILYARGNCDAALTHLRFAQKDQHTQKAACQLLAEILQRLGKPADADEARRRAAELPDDPYWPDALNEEVIDLRQGKHHAIQWARVLSKNGEGAKAIEVLKQAVKDYPEADDAWLNLGNVLLKYKNPQLAAHALRRATELAPESHEAHYHLGAALIVLRDLPGATDCFRKSSQLKSDFAPAHHNLGNCLADAGNIDAAIESFRTAVRFDPTLFESHVNLARFLMSKKRHAEALVHAQTAVRLRPRDVEAQHLVQRAAAAVLPFGFP